MSYNDSTKTELQEWLDAAESHEIRDGYIRVWTDQSHGFYVDVWANGHYDIGGGDAEGEDTETVNKFMADMMHGYEGHIDEFKQIIGI
jgi:hypothetical protein